MTGAIYNMDEWLQLISKKEKNDISEGAQWWLSRIREKANF